MKEPQTPTNIPIDLESLYDMLLDGGPLMVPIALCSVVALAYTVERWVRLSPSALGNRRLARRLTDEVKSSGAAGGVALCRSMRKPLARILGAGLGKQDAMQSEQAAEDVGKRELGRLIGGLRPLVVVAMISPLLGLLGTVWGMIEAFSNIATQDGLGKPELLAGGISQALISTAAGLAIAIPTQAVYYYYRSRIDKFARLAEDTQVQLGAILFEPESVA
ncbi:MAG: biopolymer transport protein ExbB [Candidatus Paceibacteria bacterium]|jgi:biopolymer transport protein ExbB